MIQTIEITFRQVGGFHRITRIPKPLNLTATYDITYILLKVVLNTITPSTLVSYRPEYQQDIARCHVDRAWQSSLINIIIPYFFTSIILKDIAVRALMSIFSVVNSWRRVRNRPNAMLKSLVQLRNALLERWNNIQQDLASSTCRIYSM